MRPFIRIEKFMKGSYGLGMSIGKGHFADVMNEYYICINLIWFYIVFGIVINKKGSDRR